CTKAAPRRNQKRAFVSLAKSGRNPFMSGTKRRLSRRDSAALERAAGDDVNARFWAGWRTWAVLALGVGAAFLAVEPDRAQPLSGAVGVPAPANSIAQIQLRPDQVATLQQALAQAETQGFEHDAFTPAGL